MKRLISRRVMLPIAALAVIISVAAFSAGGNPLAQGRPNTPSAPASDVEALQIRPDFYLIAGAGGDIAVQVGSDGVVLVDAGLAAIADSVGAALRRITPGPIRYIILTSADADHVGGNEAFLRAGQTSFNAIANYFPRNFVLSGPVAILSAENVLKRMSAPTGQTWPYPAVPVWFRPGPPRIAKSSAFRCISRASRVYDPTSHGG